MGKLAVQGCELEVTPVTVSVTSKQITTSPSNDILVNNKGVYFGTISVSLSGMMQGSMACPSGTVTINGTESNVTSGDQNAVQEGDNGTATFTFTDSSTGATSDIPVTVKISSAGQSDVYT
jgi:hypothetical protein